MRRLSQCLYVYPLLSPLQFVENLCQYQTCSWTSAVCFWCEMVRMEIMKKITAKYTLSWQKLNEICKVSASEVLAADVYYKSYVRFKHLMSLPNIFMKKCFLWSIKYLPWTNLFDGWAKMRACSCINCAMSWENLFLPYAENKGAKLISLRICAVWSVPLLFAASSFYIRHFKSLPSFCGCAGRFMSCLVTNPEDRFSRDEAQLE